MGDDRVRPFESSYDSRFGAGYGGGNGEDFGESEGDAPRWEDGWELVDERNGIWLDVDTLRIGLGLDPPGHAFDADRVEGSGDGDVDGGDLSSRGLSDSDEEEEEDDDIVLARMMSTMDGQLGERVPVVEVDAADGSVERGRGRRCSWPRLGRRSGPERQEVTAESSSTSQPARDPSGTLLNGSVSSSRRDDSTAENPSPSGRRVQFADLPTRAESTSRHGDGASSAAEHIEYSSTGHHHGLDSGYQRHYSATYQHDNRHLWDEDLTRGRSRERRADRVGGNSRALPSTRTYAAVAQAGMDRETREATASERPVVGSGGFDDDDEDLQRAIALSLMD